MTTKAKNPIIRTHYGYPEYKGETNNGESQTVQGEAMSIEDIVRSNGMLQTREEQYPYLDAKDLESIDKFFRPDLDLTDIGALKERTEGLQAVVSKVEKKIADEKKAEEEKRQFQLKFEEERKRRAEEAKNNEETE